MTGQGAEPLPTLLARIKATAMTGLRTRGQTYDFLADVGEAVTRLDDVIGYTAVVGPIGSPPAWYVTDTADFYTRLWWSPQPPQLPIVPRLGARRDGRLLLSERAPLLLADSDDGRLAVEAARHFGANADAIIEAFAVEWETRSIELGVLVTGGEPPRPDPWGPLTPADFRLLREQAAAVRADVSDASDATRAATMLRTLAAYNLADHLTVVLPPRTVLEVGSPAIRTRRYVTRPGALSLDDTPIDSGLLLAGIDAKRHGTTLTEHGRIVVDVFLADLPWLVTLGSRGLRDHAATLRQAIEPPQASTAEKSGLG